MGIAFRCGPCGVASTPEEWNAKTQAQYGEFAARVEQRGVDDGGYHQWVCPACGDHLDADEVARVRRHGSELVWVEDKEHVGDHYTAEITQEEHTKLDRAFHKDGGIWVNDGGSRYRKAAWSLGTSHQHSAAPASRWWVHTDHKDRVEEALRAEV